jgi:glutamine synthetase
LRTSVDAFPHLINEKNIELFTKFGIYSEAEMHSRYEIYLDTYVKTIDIEALTMVDMIKKQIVPAVNSYVKDLCEAASLKNGIFSGATNELEKELVCELSDKNLALYRKCRLLESHLDELSKISGGKAQADHICNVILPTMNEARAIADSMEKCVSEEKWPFPTYNDLLFRI